MAKRKVEVIRPIIACACCVRAIPVNQRYIKCVECSTTLCINCFRFGFEGGRHKRGHNYNVHSPPSKKNVFPKDRKLGKWDKSRDIALIHAARQTKCSNWKAIAKVMKFKGSAKILQNYFDKFFVRGSFGQTVIKQVSWEKIMQGEKNPRWWWDPTFIYEFQYQILMDASERFNQKINTRRPSALRNLLIKYVKKMQEQTNADKGKTIGSLKRRKSKKVILPAKPPAAIETIQLDGNGCEVEKESSVEEVTMTIPPLKVRLLVGADGQLRLAAKKDDHKKRKRAKRRKPIEVHSQEHPLVAYNEHHQRTNEPFDIRVRKDPGNIMDVRVVCDSIASSTVFKPDDNNLEEERRSVDLNEPDDGTDIFEECNSDSNLDRHSKIDISNDLTEIRKSHSPELGDWMQTVDKDTVKKSSYDACSVRTATCQSSQVDGSRDHGPDYSPRSSGATDYVTPEPDDGLISSDKSSEEPLIPLINEHAKGSNSDYIAGDPRSPTRRRNRGRPISPNESFEVSPKRHKTTDLIPDESPSTSKHFRLQDIRQERERRYECMNRAFQTWTDDYFGKKEVLASPPSTEGTRSKKSSRFGNGKYGSVTPNCTTGISIESDDDDEPLVIVCPVNRQHEEKPEKPHLPEKAIYNHPSLMNYHDDDPQEDFIETPCNRRRSSVIMPEQHSDERCESPAQPVQESSSPPANFEKQRTCSPTIDNIPKKTTVLDAALDGDYWKPLALTEDRSTRRRRSTIANTPIEAGLAPGDSPDLRKSCRNTRENWKTPVRDCSSKARRNSCHHSSDTFLSTPELNAARSELMKFFPFGGKVKDATFRGFSKLYKEEISGIDVSTLIQKFASSCSFRASFADDAEILYQFQFLRENPRRMQGAMAPIGNYMYFRWFQAASYQDDIKKAFGQTDDGSRKRTSSESTFDCCANHERGPRKSAFYKFVSGNESPFKYRSTDSCAPMEPPLISESDDSDYTEGSKLEDFSQRTKCHDRIEKPEEEKNTVEVLNDYAYAFHERRVRGTSPHNFFRRDRSKIRIMRKFNIDEDVECLSDSSKNWTENEASASHDPIAVLPEKVAETTQNCSTKRSGITSDLLDKTREEKSPTSRRCTPKRNTQKTTANLEQCVEKAVPEQARDALIDESSVCDASSPQDVSHTKRILDAKTKHDRKHASKKNPEQLAPISSPEIGDETSALPRNTHNKLLEVLLSSLDEHGFNPSEDGTKESLLDMDFDGIIETIRAAMEKLIALRESNNGESSAQAQTQPPPQPPSQPQPQPQPKLDLSKMKSPNEIYRKLANVLHEMKTKGYDMETEEKVLFCAQFEDRLPRKEYTDVQLRAAKLRRILHKNGISHKPLTFKEKNNKVQSKVEASILLKSTPIVTLDDKGDEVVKIGAAKDDVDLVGKSVFKVPKGTPRMKRSARQMESVSTPRDKINDKKVNMSYDDDDRDKSEKEGEIDDTGPSENKKKRKKKRRTQSKKERRLAQIMRKRDRLEKEDERALEQMTKVLGEGGLKERHIDRCPRFAKLKWDRVTSMKGRNEEKEVLAYYPHRNDFELEYFNDAETLIARTVVSDLPPEKADDPVLLMENYIKMVKAQFYNRITEYRLSVNRGIETYQKIKEFFSFLKSKHGDKRKPSEILEARPKEEKLLERTQQCILPEELDALQKKKAEIHALVEKIKKLQEMQKKGLTELGEDYHLEEATQAANADKKVHKKRRKKAKFSNKKDKFSAEWKRIRKAGHIDQ